MKKILFTLFLAAALTGARGQIYIDSYRFAGPSECGGLLLDSDCMPDAELALSFRKLRTAYTGNCVEVRNATTGRTFNIGFVNDFLDTTRLKDSCLTANCFVRTWYDQSGLGRDATQTGNNSAQPQIVNNGALYRNNGIVGMRFNQNSGTDIFLTSGSAVDWVFLHSSNNSGNTTISVGMPTEVAEINFYVLWATISGANFATTTGRVQAYDNRNNLNRGNLFFDAASKPTSALIFNNPSDTGVVNVTKNHLAISFAYPGNATANQKVFTYLNNLAAYNKNVETNTSTSNPTNTLHIGKYTDDSNSRWRGFISEIVLTDIDYKAKVESIKTNINNIYNLW